MENKKLEKFFLIGFFLILALPLLNLPPLFSPPDWGKTIVFRIILSIMIFVFIWQVLFKNVSGSHPGGRRDGFPDNTGFSKEIKIILFLLLALFGIFLLATIFSLDPHFSFWGNPYRAGGFLNFAFYIIFAILAFLIIRQRDWQKIWDFSIFIGILVCVVAIFQQFGILKEIFIFTERRPPSTIGITTALSIYLLLLSFLTLAFGIKTPWRKWFGAKKIYYLLSFVLFILVSVFITQTRSVYIGLAVGFLYFLFFYPAFSGTSSARKFLFKKAILIKVFTAILLILIGFTVYYVNTQPELPQFVKENKILKWTANRLSIKTALKDPRVSGWPVAWQAVKARPILGYGPENFSIGFDKFYDPSLPLFLGGGERGGWWDRAHNIFFDTVGQAGILAFIIYLSLFIILFQQLQKLKRAEKNADISSGKPSRRSPGWLPGQRPEQKYYDEQYRNFQSPVICHGIQATLLAYFTANIFSFDVFSTYLIFFLIIGYSLYLISENCGENRKGENYKDQTSTVLTNPSRSVLDGLRKYRAPVLVLLLVGLIWFIWQYNIKPLHINTQINIALHQAEKKNFEGAVATMENILPCHSFLDNYLRLQYVSVIGQCIEKNPETAGQLAPRAYFILKENIKLRPYYTRNWMLLGAYTNHLIIKEQEANPELAEKLKEEADYYFEKANELSPERQEILVEWIKTDFYREQFSAAEKKAQKCIEYNPNFKECYWQMYLANVYLKNEEEAEKYFKIAKEKRCPINSEVSLLEIVNAYIKTENYQKLAETYQSLIKLKPEKPQYYASLATCYKILGEYEKAKEEAFKVLEISPESKEMVEEFLRSLE